MNAKLDSGTPPQKEQINVKQKKETIVNRLTYATLEGVNAQVIEVEATFTKGLPGFAVVGLASSDIQEAKERTKSALLTNDFVFPPLIHISLIKIPNIRSVELSKEIALLFHCIFKEMASFRSVTYCKYASLICSRHFYSNLQ
jgi:hypothetical protein